MKLTYILFCIAAFCVACDPLANPHHGSVSFSSDTLFFDTVFTTMGSATMEVRAINKSSRPLLLDRVWLAGGSTSPYRINIDGTPDYQLDDITLAAGDSLFVFVEVKIDPLDSDLPVSVTDSIMFQSGNDVSRVFLQAWGQDIILLRNERVGDVLWSGLKPYVIYGDLFVDTAKTLSITRGTRIYFHNDASMTVAGRIVVSGEKDSPVLFASDMTYKAYDDVPGQWKGISFETCSNGNKISDAVIRNADIALNLKGDILKGVPDIDLYNVTVLHNSVSSLYAASSNVKAANCVFGHTGFSAINIVSGGNAEFIQCTVAEKWEYNYRSAPALNIGKGNGTQLPVVSVSNSVITGDLKNEIAIEGGPSDIISKVFFDTCLIQVDTLSTPWWNHRCFKGPIIGRKPGFINWNDYDYRPDTLSELTDRAGKIKGSLLPEDIRHKPRPVFNGPDIGAYERQKGEKSD
jgi:hypothetical protein